MALAEEGFNCVYTLKNDRTTFGHTAEEIKKRARAAIALIECLDVVEGLLMEGVITFWGTTLLEAPFLSTSGDLRKNLGGLGGKWI